MNMYRVLSNCLDRAGMPLPITWHGEALTPQLAVEKMLFEAASNGWTDVEIIRIYERKKTDEMGVAA